MTDAPRLLFVPVSGAFGMGEYARSLAIAQGAVRRWPHAAVHFILSRDAPYAGQAPFPTLQLPSSPTFHTAEVVECIQAWHPDVVIFDNAGRTAQLQAARCCGARVVYVSARRKQRRKAFRLRWMHLIDEHWIAYPRIIAGDLGPFERLKMRLMGRPTVRYLDVVMATARRGFECGGDGGEGDYVLVVPGGGTGHPGALGAMAEFLGAARSLAASGVPTVFVGRGPEDEARGESSVAGVSSGGEPSGGEAALRMTGPLPQEQLAALMRGARTIVANGGSTLLQSLAYGKACVAVPIAADQRSRIRRCVAAGVVETAALAAPAIAAAADELWRDGGARHVLETRAAALGFADGVAVAVDALAALLASKQG